MGDTMNDDQANRFAQRMIETWPDGPRRNIWHDIATKLHDQDAARTTYTELERSAPKISTALFHTTYLAVKRRTETIAPPERCELCDNTGWVDAPPRQMALDEPPKPETSHVLPCRCTRGDQMAETRRRILEHNAR
jgi:hypothetical protein